MKVKVFKFGGGVICTAQKIMAMKDLIFNYKTNNPEVKLIVVISAFGETTRDFEELAKEFLRENYKEASQKLNEIRNLFFTQVMGSLFSFDHRIFRKVDQYFQMIEKLLAKKIHILEATDYRVAGYLNDKILSFGELITSTIISEYLIKENIPNIWADARFLIHTNDKYGSAEVNYPATKIEIQQYCNNQFKDKDVIVTQGFIGGTIDTEMKIFCTTTLGFEGSDFSAGIFGYALHDKVDEIILFKNVPGILNGDITCSNARIIPELSFEDFLMDVEKYKKIVHPKTIEVLQLIKGKVPSLFVKSFANLDWPGTELASEKVFKNRKKHSNILVACEK